MAGSTRNGRYPPTDPDVAGTRIASAYAPDPEERHVAQRDVARVAARAGSTPARGAAYISAKNAMFSEPGCGNRNGNASSAPKITAARARPSVEAGSQRAPLADAEEPLRTEEQDARSAR